MGDRAPRPACTLCAETGGTLVWRGDWLRVVRADEAQHPAFYRVIWNAHAPEFSDLEPLQRVACLDAVVLLEQCLRQGLRPSKINLASLGNMVPHLHWHVIARWDWDAHWPQPVWAAAQRPADPARLESVRAALPEVEGRMREALGQRFGASDHA